SRGWAWTSTWPWAAATAWPPWSSACAPSPPPSPANRRPRPGRGREAAGLRGTFMDNRIPLGMDRVDPNNAEPKPPYDPDEPLEAKVVAVLKTCYDPEIPVNIFELGLIYKIDVSPEGRVDVKMTLTSPACPVAGSLPGEIESKVKA